MNPIIRHTLAKNYCKIDFLSASIRLFNFSKEFATSLAADASSLQPSLSKTSAISLFSLMICDVSSIHTVHAIMYINILNAGSVKLSRAGISGLRIFIML